MCKAKLYKSGKPNSRIDKCMKTFIENLNIIKKKEYKIKACCCGHGKYPMTIIIHAEYCNLPALGGTFDLVSGIKIYRKRRFYKRDKQGYYYIPEVSQNPQKQNEVKKDGWTRTMLQRYGFWHTRR